MLNSLAVYIQYAYNLTTRTFCSWSYMRLVYITLFLLPQSKLECNLEHINNSAPSLHVDCYLMMYVICISPQLELCLFSYNQARTRFPKCWSNDVVSCCWTLGTLGLQWVIIIEQLGIDLLKYFYKACLLWRCHTFKSQGQWLYSLSM